MDGIKRSNLLAQLALGEDSTRQFKADVKNADSLASEMAAFANTNGGTIFIGVADDGSTPGLSGQDVARINQLISNAASQLVRSPLAVQTENVALENGRIVIVLNVPKGIDKPYFDKNGVIWLKAGGDKRRVNSKEELLVNALVHRDYLVSAPIRLFVFDNRIDIISPGHLPNNLTVEKIRTGNSNIRNPILVSYVAKGMLPYHGLGSGIKRALEKWPSIDFTDDYDGCLFTATVHRRPVEELELADKGAIKAQDAPIKASLSGLQVRLLDFIRSNPAVSYDELADMTRKDRTTVMRNIGKLKDAGILRRVGSKKTGHWEVME